MKTLFGVVEMPGLIAPKYRRHELTDELVGRAMTWASQATDPPLLHPEDGGGAVRSARRGRCCIIGPSCPLVEMAREQGGGFIRRFESGEFQRAYVQQDGIWTPRRITYRSV